MAANAWLAKLNVSPEAACRCGHNAYVHSHGKSCTAQTDGLKFCKCEEFRESQNLQGDEMAKEKKARVSKPKGGGRTPRLAGMVDSPLTIFMTTGGKEYKGTVLTSGIIKVDEKEFTSPSSAGQYILGNNAKGKPLQVDGWKSWRFNKDGERVPLDVLRGGKSPLKATEAPKREKKAKTPKADRPRKPRAAKKRAVVEQPAQEATAAA